MNCKCCGAWFSSSDASQELCAACRRALARVSPIIESLSAELEATEAIAALARGLEVERDQLKARLEHVEFERDAAVEDIRKAAWCGCHVCKHYYQPDPNSRIHSCKKYGDFDKHDFIADDGSIFCGAMEWRGVKEGTNG